MTEQKQSKKSEAGPDDKVIEALAASEQKISPRVEQTRKQRRRRRDRDFSAAGRRLYVPEQIKDPNFVYRWVNGDESRIKALTEYDDWDFVTKEMLDHPDMEARNADIGTRVTRPAGKDADGKPLMAYFVRKPREFHDEDMRSKRAAIHATVSGLRRGRVNDPKSLSGDKSYVPKDGISISD